MLSYQVCWKKFENVIEVRLKLSKKTLFFLFSGKEIDPTFSSVRSIQ